MTRKILVVGASGLIGHAVADELSKNHEVIRASRNGDERVDMSDIDSVRALFERIGDVDDVVCCAGAAPFKHVTELSPEDYEDGLRSKAMGQINVVTEGMKRVADGGSFTLISGILTTVPIHGSVAPAVANGAVESCVVTAASELPRGAAHQRGQPDRSEGGHGIPLGLPRLQTGSGRRRRSGLRPVGRRRRERTGPDRLGLTPGCMPFCARVTRTESHRVPGPTRILRRSSGSSRAQPVG